MQMLFILFINPLLIFTPMKPAKVLQSIKKAYKIDLKSTAHYLFNDPKELQWCLQFPIFENILIDCIPYWMARDSQKCIAQAQKIKLFSPAKQAEFLIQIIKEMVKFNIDPQTFIAELSIANPAFNGEIFLHFINLLAIPPKKNEEMLLAIRELTKQKIWPESPLGHLLNQIEKFNNANNINSSLNKLVTIVLISMIYDTKIIDFLLNENILSNIFLLNNPVTRDNITELLLTHILFNKSSKKILLNLNNNIINSFPLINILIASISNKGDRNEIDEKTLLMQLNAIKDGKKKFFSDNTRFQNFVSSFISLINEIDKNLITIDQMYLILLKTLEINPKKISSTLHALQGIIAFEQLPHLLLSLENQNYSIDKISNENFKNSFKELFNFNIEDKETVDLFMDRLSKIQEDSMNLSFLLLKFRIQKMDTM